jgi:tRNA G18 (ribose-2'-O)-methylase SpoU
MQTRCPNPECAIEFDLSGDDLDKRGHAPGRCPDCGINATFRSPDAIAIIEREFEKRKAKGQLKGGPERAEDWVPELSVLVEDVRSLWNVGSIFRSSDGAGFQHVFLSGITGSPPRKEIEKVSLGAEQVVSWDYVVNPLQAIVQLKKRGVQIVGLEKSDESVLLSEAIYRNELKRPMCLIAGNEVSGLSPQVLHHCEIVCHLPMRGMKESLNVAVAYGIAAYMIAQGVHKT